jgi:histone H3/H4
MNKGCYALGIYKVFKLFHPQLDISCQSVALVNEILMDMTDLIAYHAARIARINRRKMISYLDIQIAVRLLFPPTLTKYAVWEGKKAVYRYYR